MTRSSLTALAAALAALAAPASAAAQPALGILPSGKVVTGFDTATPQVVDYTRAVTGLATDAERIVAIDDRSFGAFRNGGVPLVALSSNADGSVIRLYGLDGGTGAATAVGPPISTGVTGDHFSIDVDPRSYDVRVISDGGRNLLLSATTGQLLSTDTAISPVGTKVTGIGFWDTFASAATLVAIDQTTAALGRIGPAQGSPADGAFTAIGPLGVTSDAGTGVDLDVPAGGDLDALFQPRSAYAAITSAGVQRLYDVDLETGHASEVGSLGAAVSALAVLQKTYIAIGKPVIPLGDRTPIADVSESVGSTPVNVRRFGDTSRTLPFAWLTSLGQRGTAAFKPGQYDTTFDLPIIDDAVDEPDETVTVSVAAADIPVLLLGSKSLESFKILDDDLPAAAPTPDAKAPVLQLGKLPVSITYAKLLSTGLRLSVNPNEAAAIDGSLTGTLLRAKHGKTARGLLTGTKLPLTAGARTLSLKPKAKELRRPKKTVTLKLQVKATDAAGNAATLTRSIKLKPR